MYKRIITALAFMLLSIGFMATNLSAEASTETPTTETSVASPASDICRFINASGSHSLDEVRTAFFVTSTQVDCTTFHRAVNPSNGSVFRTGRCHHWTYFLTTHRLIAHPIFTCSTGNAMQLISSSTASVAHDICLYIIRASHGRDLIRAAVFVLPDQVYCSAFHYYQDSNGIWRPNGWCHEYDYFTKTNTVRHGTPRPC